MNPEPHDSAGRGCLLAERPEAEIRSGPWVTRRVDVALLKSALATLPSECRAVLLLCKLDRYSHRQIASRLGVALATVEERHARALRLLNLGLTRPPAAGDQEANP